MHSVSSLTFVQALPPKKGEEEGSSRLFFVALCVASLVVLAIGVAGMYGKFSPTPLSYMTFKVTTYAAATFLALVILFRLGSNWYERMRSEKESSMQKINEMVLEAPPAPKVVEPPPQKPASPASAIPVTPSTPKTPLSPIPLNPSSPLPQMTPMRLFMTPADSTTAIVRVTENSPLKSARKPDIASPQPGALIDLFQMPPEPIFHTLEDSETVLKSIMPYKCRLFLESTVQYDFSTIVKDNVIAINCNCYFVESYIKSMGDLSKSHLESDGKEVIHHLCDAINTLHNQIFRLEELLGKARAGFYTKVSIFIQQIKLNILQNAFNLVKRYNEFHERDLPNLMPLFTNQEATLNQTVQAIRMIRQGVPLRKLHYGEKLPTLFAYFLKEYAYKNMIVFNKTPAKQTPARAAAPTLTSVSMSLTPSQTRELILNTSAFGSPTTAADEKK